MSYQEIDVRPYCGNLGAEIFGVDLRETISDSVFDEIHQALLENCVIFFRDQELTPEQRAAVDRAGQELEVGVGLGIGNGQEDAPEDEPAEADQGVELS